MDNFKVGNIVRDKRSGDIFELIEVYGTSAVAAPIDAYNKVKNDRFAVMLEDMELVLDEASDAFNTLFGDDDGTT